MLQKSQLRFVRSSEGLLGGVCEGLGESFDMDPWAIRLFWVLSICIFGTGALLYLIAWLTLPKKDQLDFYYKKKILGVCLRLSEQTTLELPLIRFLAVVSLFASVGISLFVYLFLHFFMPKKYSRYEL